jgi:hypothetical protein
MPKNKAANSHASGADVSRSFNSLLPVRENNIDEAGKTG